MSSEEENSPRQSKVASNIQASQMDDRQYNEEPVIPHHDGDDEYAASKLRDNEEIESGPESSKIKKLIEEENTGIEVNVKNPQRRGGNIGGFFVYDVDGQDKQGTFSCKRRYNDFHELRSKLVENWPGIFIPPLPEKKSVVLFE